MALGWAGGSVAVEKFVGEQQRLGELRPLGFGRRGAEVGLREGAFGGVGKAGENAAVERGDAGGGFDEFGDLGLAVYALGLRAEKGGIEEEERL